MRSPRWLMARADLGDRSGRWWSRVVITLLLAADQRLLYIPGRSVY